MGFFNTSKLLNASLLFIIVLHLSSVSVGSKYSAKTNMKTLDLLDQDLVLEEDIDGLIESDENPFRMKKVNLLWAKAKKILSKPKLADLYADLKVHDRAEAHLKKLKVGNLDKDGKKEAEVLKKYENIVEFYTLSDYYRRQNLDNEIPLTDDETKSVHFPDPKLQSMWNRAEKSGFSDEDLQILKEEFWHQQMKLNEFDFMRSELSKHSDTDENDVNADELKVKLSPEQKTEKMIELKEHNKNIREGYLKLEQMASKLPKTELEFKDYRVQKLWALAKKTNWSEEELESFKEELKHFEHRLSKQDYYQEQLELTRDALKSQLKEGEPYPEKLAQLKEKSSSIKQKVTKLHGHMKKRLEKALKHTEL